MPTDTFTVRRKPKAVATKALGIMKRARLGEFKLKQSSVTQGGDGFVAKAKWEESGFFGDSAELQVEAKEAFNGATEVVVTTFSDRCAKLAGRLRKEL